MFTAAMLTHAVRRTHGNRLRPRWPNRIITIYHYYLTSKRVTFEKSPEERKKVKKLQGIYRTGLFLVAVPWNGR